MILIWRCILSSLYPPLKISYDIFQIVTWPFLYLNQTILTTLFPLFSLHFFLPRHLLVLKISPRVLPTRTVGETSNLRRPFSSTPSDYHRPFPLLSVSLFDPWLTKTNISLSLVFFSLLVGKETLSPQSHRRRCFGSPVIFVWAAIDCWFQHFTGDKEFDFFVLRFSFWFNVSMAIRLGWVDKKSNFWFVVVKWSDFE